MILDHADGAEEGYVFLGQNDSPSLVDDGQVVKPERIAGEDVADLYCRASQYFFHFLTTFPLASYL